jgi:hypothetical protein
MLTRVLVLSLMILMGNTLAYAAAPVPESAKGVLIFPRFHGHLVKPFSLFQTA